MELTAMKNIGVEMQKKLNEVSIANSEDLIQIGSKEAFSRLKAVYPEVCLVHLYSLQGAIDGVDFNMLPTEVKDELKLFSDSLK